jgi:DNA-binding LacI/PurR family transcriptional regulator
VDNYSASYAIVDHLMQLGHRRVGLIIGPYHRLNRLQQRLDAYRDCLSHYDVAFEARLVMDRDHSMLSGAEAMRQMLRMEDRPTAVFAASDVLAYGALSEIKRSGLQVPADISIAGFDDIEFAAFSDPPLTTVHVPAREMGTQAVRVLLDMTMRGDEAIAHYCFDSDVIQRKSTGPIHNQAR